jgi:hypothetical protein
MRKLFLLLVICCTPFLLAGCAVFISAERLRGPVPAPEVLAAQQAAAADALAAEAAGGSSKDAALIAELEGKVGEDLVAQATFSGRETPRSAPLRGARIETGEQIRVSASRAQQIAVEAEEYCVEQGARCSRVWVYGRVSGGTLGAWYPIVIFDYPLPQ